MKAKKTIIIILILSLIMLVGGMFVYFYYDELFNNKNELIEVEIAKNDLYSEIRKINDNYILVKENEKYGIIDNEGNVVEEIKYDYIQYLIDDYYFVELDNIKTLKRKGKVVADITNYERGKAYKDENDSSSVYIMIDEFFYNTKYRFLSYYGNYKYDDSLRTTKIIKNYDNYNGVSGTVEYGSIVYDSKTGKIIKEVPGIIERKDEEQKYKVYYYLHGSAGLTYTYYDKNFNNILGDNVVFSSFQCDGNNITTIKDAKTNYTAPKKYGYYSIEKEKILLPVQYDNIISKNDLETLFVVKNNGKYLLLDDNNARKFNEDYEYIEIINNYIFAVKDNVLKVYNGELNELNEYSYDIDLNATVDLGGLCEAPYSQIYNLRNIDAEVGILNVATTSGKKTFVIYDNSIEVLDENIEFEYLNRINNEKVEVFYLKSKLNGDIIEEITIYNPKMKEIDKIDVREYKINKDVYGSNYSYESLFGVDYLIIAYRNSEDIYIKHVYDMDKKVFVNSEIVDFNKISIEKTDYEYDYSNINKYSDNYYYKVIRTDDESTLKLYDKNKNLIDGFKDFSGVSIINNYFVFGSQNGYRLYKLN